MSFHFEPLALQPLVLEGLASMGFSEPTPVQQQAIPLILAKRDVIIQAKTGSGKTLAYGLPLLSRLKTGPRPQALVIVPTRELAAQVSEAIAQVGVACGLRVVALYGGMSLRQQRKAIQGGQDIVVGTPGRLKDLAERDSLDLSGIRFVVLDEADRMFDMGFRKDMDFLLHETGEREQLVVLSATFPQEIASLVRKQMTKPARVELLDEGEVPAKLSHWYLRVPKKKRFARLVSLLRAEKPARAILFTEMKHETEHLAQWLGQKGDFKVGALNGNMPQVDRNKMLARFKNGDVTLLVATDIAARGLDIEGLSHVFHYSIPKVVDTYIHRSGRTARNGNVGKTIMLVVPEQEAEFEAIQRRIPCVEYPHSPGAEGSASKEPSAPIPGLDSAPSL
ncbi:DEAD/DEAH box helicase [bacterium]|nr:DEAD/DEAH box helicase [bacterium]